MTLSSSPDTASTPQVTSDANNLSPEYHVTYLSPPPPDLCSFFSSLLTIHRQTLTCNTITTSLEISVILSVLPHYFPISGSTLASQVPSHYPAKLPIKLALLRNTQISQRQTLTPLRVLRFCQLGHLARNKAKPTSILFRNHEGRRRADKGPLQGQRGRFHHLRRVARGCAELDQGPKHPVGPGRQWIQNLRDAQVSTLAFLNLYFLYS
jgi:hypothetical protein